MVGPGTTHLPLLLLLLTLLLGPEASQAEDSCSVFRREYCNLRLDKILMLDTALSSPSQCQTACFERKNCTEFTFFEGANSRCVLFNQCASPVSSCKSCLSGPPFPRVSNCLPATQQRIDQPRSFPKSEQRQTTEQPRRASVSVSVVRNSGGQSSFQGSFRSGATA